MTVIDDLSRMASHMIEGVMVHEQLMNVYLFAGLYGESVKHKSHYLAESQNYADLCEYCMKVYGVLVNASIKSTAIPSLIPKSWLSSSQFDLDYDTRIEIIKSADDEWIKWETETLDLYNDIYSHLIASSSSSTSEFIKKYILDVESELMEAKREKLEHSAVNYDMPFIMERQETMEHFYNKEIVKHIKEKLK